MMRILQISRLWLRPVLVANLAFAFAVSGCGGRSASAPAGSSAAGGSAAGSAGMSAPLDAGQCRGSEDCKGVTSCVEPGGMPWGGVCPALLPTCSTDNECQTQGSNWICDPLPPACGDAKTCTLGCAADSDCNVGQVCKQGHCTQPACAKDADCPTDFLCSAYGCARKSCSNDSACSAYCVNELCFSTPGTCEQRGL